MFPVEEGVVHLLELHHQAPESQQVIQLRAEQFEAQHCREREPWRYSQRAAELLRHEHVCNLVTRYSCSPQVIIELGCSQGLLSRKLRGLSASFYGIDISVSAARKAWEHWKNDSLTNHHRGTSHATNGRFIVASATSLPFLPNSTDVIICSDGLFGWELPRPMQQEVLQQCAVILRPGGIMILTDYLHPRRFDELIRIVSASPLSILSVEYLYDRFWYQFESWFHLVESWRWVQAILRNMAIARLLKSFGRLFGKHGSKHICIVAKKAENQLS